MIHATAILAQDFACPGQIDVGAFAVIGEDPPFDDWPPPQIGPGAHIRSHTVVYRGVQAGRRLSTGHGVLVRQGSMLGDDVSIGSHTILEHHVTIGDRVRVHSSVFIPEYTTLRTGSWVGPGVIFTNAKYPNRPNTKDHLAGVTVMEDAVVGAGAVLLPGVTIGCGAIVGAGAIVTRDVRQNAVVYGDRARDRVNA